MIRFVIEIHEMQYGPGIDRRDYVTLDMELPNLEAMLKRGARGEGGFESWRLLGAEVLTHDESIAQPKPPELPAEFVEWLNHSYGATDYGRNYEGADYERARSDAKELLKSWLDKLKGGV